MKLFLLLCGTLIAALVNVSTSITIGFTEIDYATSEDKEEAKLILTVAELPINLTIPLVIMSFEQFENKSLKLPDVIDFDNRNPAEYSLDPAGRRDFVNNGVIEVTFSPMQERQVQEIIVPIVDDPYNEASESFLVLVDPDFDISEAVPQFLRDGIALVTIMDNDPIKLQFDRTSYTVNEAEGLVDEMIRITKGGVESEQVIGGVVEVVDLFPNNAILNEDYVSNKTYSLTFYPENASLPFPVNIIDDKKAENIEQFGLVMSVANSLAGNGKNNSATVYIIDSSDVVIGFENNSYSVREGSTSEICITVKEPQDTVLDFFVPTLISTVDGSAIATQDFVAISRTVSATTRMCFTVTTIDNNVTNVVRNFTVTIRFTPFGISRTFITDTPSITITIEDDDGDPCERNNCDMNADCVVAQSNPQGYQCVCKMGYVGDGRTCEDPCSSGLNDCDTNADCSTTTDSPGYQCTCKPGYLGNGRTCTAICSPGSHDCDPNASCIPTQDGRSYQCTCNQGYLGNGHTCVAICSEGSHSCHSNARCIPTQDGRDYLCQCNIGFVGNGQDCRNYCEAGLYRCHSAADCIPTPGGYTCRCKRGYVGDGLTCAAMCSPGTHGCHPRAYCIPSFGGQGYSCRCGIGTVGDGYTCRNYCEAGVHNCHRHADCTPTFGGYQCKCRPGYTGNGVTCTDINECLSGNECDTNADCTNTDGGYSCSCKKDFLGNGLNCFLVMRESNVLRIEVAPTTVPSPTTTEAALPTTEEAALPTTEPSDKPPVLCDEEEGSESSRRTTRRTSRSATTRTKTKSGSHSGTKTGTKSGSKSWTRTGTKSGSKSWTKTGTTDSAQNDNIGCIRLQDSSRSRSTQSRSHSSSTSRSTSHSSSTSRSTSHSSSTSRSTSHSSSTSRSSSRSSRRSDSTGRGSVALDNIDDSRSKSTKKSSRRNSRSSRSHKNSRT